MFSDRSYARDAGQNGEHHTSALVWLLCAIGASFILQQIFVRMIPGGAGIPAEAAALTPALLLKGRVWTLLTYTLLHGGVLHLILNGITIYFMGRETLPLLGNKRFAAFCAAAAAGGGLLWVLVNFHHPHNMLIGASSISLALLVLFACFYPNNKITVLLFFIIPISIRPKYVAIAAAVLDVCGMLLLEIPGTAAADLSVAYSAHVGGMLVAVGYYFLIHKRIWRSEDAGAASVLPEWLQKKKKPAAIATPKYKVNITSRDDLKVEVDRILDKINSQGFSSLTDEEKRVLDSAKDMLSGR